MLPRLIILVLILLLVQRILRATVLKVRRCQSSCYISSKTQYDALFSVYHEDVLVVTLLPIFLNMSKSIDFHDEYSTVSSPYRISFLLPCENETQKQMSERLHSRP